MATCEGAHGGRPLLPTPGEGAHPLSLSGFNPGSSPPAQLAQRDSQLTLLTAFLTLIMERDVKHGADNDTHTDIPNNDHFRS